ncbi:MAG: holo-ACP synthase [Gaiellales bacterium]
MRVGIDLIEIERVARALQKRPRFAGKEAVGKALGCGVEFMWRDVEIAGRPKPSVILSGKIADWGDRVAAGSIDLSMTHSREMAGAVAIVHDR